MARRADRRLREVIRQAGILATDARAEEGNSARFAHASLTMKVAVAERVGRRALGRLTGESATRARALADRIRRHALVADAGLERAAARLTGIEAREASVPPTPAEPASYLPDWRRVALVAAGAFVILAIFVAPAWLERLQGTQPTGEGTMGGFGAGPTSPASDPTGDPASPDPVSPDPSEGPAEVDPVREAAVVIGFDEVRMGSGIGAGWRPTTGSSQAVAVAAFPTAVDRSARLDVVDGRPVATCMTFETPIMSVTRLSVDVLVRTPTATAALSVGPVEGETALRMNLGPPLSSLVEGSRVLAAGDRLAPETWYRAEITVRNELMTWRVTALDAAEEPLIEATIETDALAAVGEICLAASGESDDTVHFDDLAIANN